MNYFDKTKNDRWISPGDYISVPKLGKTDSYVESIEFLKASWISWLNDEIGEIKNLKHNVYYVRDIIERDQAYGDVNIYNHELFVQEGFVPTKEHLEDFLKEGWISEEYYNQKLIESEEYYRKRLGN